MKKRLILLGGGHAHLSVLAKFADHPNLGFEVILVTERAFQHYSGMLPGWMAGHYSKPQAQIDLRPLAAAARVQLVLGQAIGINADERRLVLADQSQLEYDLLSIDVGSEIDAAWLEMVGARLLPVKPLEAFFSSWPKVLQEAGSKADYSLAVVGGGAAGVELAMAAQFAFMQHAPRAEVHLVTSESGILNGHAASVKKRAMKTLIKAGVTVHRHKAVGTPEGLLLSDGTALAVDKVIAATGARAPVWLTLSKLALDASGYITVDDTHRSISHREVFAVGDVCARQDVKMARSGVHAVRAGPVLAQNLLAAMQGCDLKPYRPRRHSLYLLACGTRYAIASWGRFSAEGAWVWRWKDWIDRGFIRRFSPTKDQH